MGSVKQRGKIYHIDLTVNGRRIRRKAGKSKKLAEQLLHDLELKAQRDELEFFEKKDLPIKVFVERFIAYSETNHRKATTVRYRSSLGNFRLFAETEAKITNLSQITREIIEQFKNWRKNRRISKNGKPLEKVQKSSIQKGAKAFTVNFEISTLKTALKLAVEWGYLRRSPAEGIKELKTEDSKRRRFLSEAECRVILSAAPKEYYPVFFTFMNTGMRRGELVNLEWADVDFERRVIKIQKKPFWQPKTGEREIPMNQELVLLLNGLPKRGRFVFCDKKGKQLHADKIRRVLREIAAKAEIPDLTEVHALRHTFISELIKKGADIPTVQKLAGHRDIQTTMIYTHQTNEQVRNAVELLNYGAGTQKQGVVRIS